MSSETVKKRSQRTTSKEKKDKHEKEKEDIWKCPICWENEKNWNYPLSLGCGHSVCQFCLLKLHIKYGQSSPCPECRAIISHFNPNYPLGRMLGLDYMDKYNQINTIYLEDPSLAQMEEDARKNEAEFLQEHVEAEHRDVINVVEQILRQEGEPEERGNITIGNRANGGVFFRTNIQGLRLQNVYRNPVNGIRMNRWLMVGIFFIAFMIIFSVWYFWPGAVMTFFYILFIIYLCYIYMCNRNN